MVSMSMRNACRQSGMTLIEVMVALFISTIGLLGMLAIMGTAFRGTDNNRRMSEASVIAQTTLERLIALPKAAFAAASATPQPCPTVTNGVEPRFTGRPAATTATPPGATATTYERNCEVARCGLLNCITVSVSWLDPGTGRTHVIRQQRGRTP